MSEQPAESETDSGTDLAASLDQTLAQLVHNDPEVIEMRRTYAVDPDDVMREARIIVAQGSFDARSRLQEIRRAEHARDRILNARPPRLARATLPLFSIAILGFAALLFVIFAQLFGKLKDIPLWPFIVITLTLGIPSGIIITIEIRRENRNVEAIQTAIAVQSMNANFHALLRSLVIIPAIEKAMSVKLVTPAEDPVSLTDAPHLASRITSNRRIETQSYREVVTNLQRDGGATIGLAGSRGVGKSELLRAFCDDPSQAPSIEDGGIIGISIPAPIAYKSEQFLRVLIRRLAEAVPGYDASLVGRPNTPSMPVNIIATLLAAASLIAGALLIMNFDTLSKHIVGWGLVALGVIIIIFILFRSLPVIIRRELADALPDLILSTLPGSTLLPIGAIWGLLFNAFSSDAFGRSNPQQKGQQINRHARQALATIAAEVARRVRYVETVSASSEASASWQSSGLTYTSGVSLDEVPLTEPDLVLELSDLVQALHAGGYGVRIGIDELDKMGQSGDAEAFLTGIKVLFSIRDCSFILTISENAFSQFARRGMPLRDVFDSSLDAVTMVQPLTFEESRRLIRARLLAGSDEQAVEKMSDTQIIFCYCLSGGLPRDFLRFCRQVGDTNSKLSGEAKLDAVADSKLSGGAKLDAVARLLLRAEVSGRIDGVRLAMQGRDEKEAGPEFMAQLELMDKAAMDETVSGLLTNLLSADPVFARLCGAEEVSSDPVRESAAGGEWIRNTRRQLLAYLYFAETVSRVFGLTGRSQFLGNSDPKEFLVLCDGLAEARRRLEMDAAAGWRRTAEVAAALQTS